VSNREQAKGRRSIFDVPVKPKPLTPSGKES
jgi:hypothetical protein